MTLNKFEREMAKLDKLFEKSTPFMCFRFIYRPISRRTFTAKVGMENELSWRNIGR